MTSASISPPTSGVTARSTPRGHELIATFDLDDGVPRWRYDLGEVRLEVEMAMAHGSSTVAVVHRLLSGGALLEVTPLCTWRDQHGDRFAGPAPDVEVTPTGFVFESAYRVDAAGFEPGGDVVSRRVPPRGGGARARGDRGPVGGGCLPVRDSPPATRSS